jgi:tripartite-type tricarboxylate transporter receptor subunit TctC
MPHIKSGKIRVIATTARKRLNYLPEIPTLPEAGVSGVDIAPWQGMLAPAGTPRPIIDRLHSEVVSMIKQPESLALLASTGTDPVGSSPEEFAAKIRHELATFGEIIKAAGLKKQ